MTQRNIKQRMLQFDDLCKPQTDDAESSDNTSSPRKVPSTLPCKTTARQWKQAAEECRERDTLPF
jgi:hypothetical protein